MVSDLERRTWNSTLNFPLLPFPTSAPIPLTAFMSAVSPNFTTCGQPSYLPAILGTRHTLTREKS